MSKLYSAILASILLVTNVMAAQSSIYIGTYTNNQKSKGIYRADFDPATGALGQPVLLAEAKNPSYVAISPSGEFLYAVTEVGTGAVAAFRINKDQSLTKLNEQPTAGAAPCHVSVDRGGKNVFVANYNGGNIACFPVADDGSLREHSALVVFQGSGPDAARQTKPHAHGIYADAQDRFVYACDLGTDQVWTFRFDSKNGTLTPTEPPAGSVPPGSGPRHFVMHPSGKFAYANNEMALTVTAFERDAGSGTLKAVQTLSTLPEGANREKASTAEIACHPSGKWLYVSNRGHDSITVFEIGADGRLAFSQNIPSLAKEPRGFGMDPSGKWLVVAGQNNDRVTVLKINGTTGQLEKTGTEIEVGAPVCIVFSPGTK